MITEELSDFLENEEKESILTAISVSDKILSSGICQYLIVDKGEWVRPETGAAVVLFVKNSSERHYRIIVIEPSSGREWETKVQYDFIIKDKKFETIQVHSKLLVFEGNSGKEIGLHFYDSKECEKFHNSVCRRQSAKTSELSDTPALTGKKEKKKEKKKGLFHHLFHHKETKKVLEIGSPTDFRHVDGVKLTEGQEDLYLQVMSKLKTENPEEEEIVKQLIIRNEDTFRQSIMMKKDIQTPKGVKEKSNKEKSRSFWSRSKPKIEDVSQPVVPVLATPVDPLKPDWNTEGSNVVTSATSFTSSSHRSSSSSVVVTSSSKQSHSMVNTVKDTDWDAPRKDTYGAINQREPHNIYRFEQTEQRIEVEKKEADERPPELPNRSSSRNVGEPMSRTGLSTPRLPSHRGSYRWATQPDTIPKPPPIPAVHSHNSHQVDEFVEMKLSTNSPIRTAPPPPPANPLSLKLPTSSIPYRETSSSPKFTSTKAAPPPPSPSVKSAPPLPPTSNKAPPPPPPLPSTLSAVPPPPPLPQTASPSDDEDSDSGPPSVRLSSVPESSTDRRSLMDQIRSTDRSKVLKKVNETPDSRQSVTSPTSGTIVDQIQSFLDARRAGINPSDSEGSDDEDDDEEWSD